MSASSPPPAPSVRRLRPGRRGGARALLLLLFVSIVGAARCTGCEASRADVSVPDPPPPPQPAVSTQATVSG